MAILFVGSAHSGFCSIDGEQAPPTIGIAPPPHGQYSNRRQDNRIRSLPYLTVTFQTFLRMPHGRGHRRVHSYSYFSGFTAVEIDQPIQKAVSSNSLHVLLQTTSLLSKAKSAQDVCDIVEAPDYPQLQTDSEVHALKKQRSYSFVTIPSFVKHSVKQTEPMARPRSPKSKNGGECSSHQHMEDKLDQTLLAIRQQLVSLTIWLSFKRKTYMYLSSNNTLMVSSH